MVVDDGVWIFLCVLCVTCLLSRSYCVLSCMCCVNCGVFYDIPVLDLECIFRIGRSVSLNGSVGVRVVPFDGDYRVFACMGVVTGCVCFGF